MTVSIVTPCYNEASGVAEFHCRLAAVMNASGEDWEAVYVNDGSRDNTLSRLQELRHADPHVAVLNLSRNFGKEIALTAGLDHCQGDWIVVIDADLQDPPELIPSLLERAEQGFDIVYARRSARKGESWLKRATASAFYATMQRMGQVQIPPDTGDFRIMSRRAVQALLGMRERHRFMKGLFAWVGFPTDFIVYDRDARYADVTSWNYWKLWNFAIEGITSHSIAPLKFASYLGFFIALIAVGYGSITALRTLMFGNPVPGYTSLIVVISFLGGIQLMTLGVIGEYVGRTFNETKHRPLYLVERFLGSAFPVRYTDGGGPPAGNRTNAQHARVDESHAASAMRPASGAMDA